MSETNVDVDRRVVLCSHCRMPIHPGSAGLRHYGTHTAHSESECLQLLHAEIERLKAELKECDDLRDRLGDLLSRTAVALRGPEPELTRWSWHDLPERAAAAIAAIDIMQRAAAINGAEAQQHNRIKSAAITSYGLLWRMAIDKATVDGCLKSEARESLRQVLSCAERKQGVDLAMRMARSNCL